MIKKVLLTSALPYVNGNFHLGHALEFVQVDIFYRYNVIVNNICFYLSGDDCHGTPVMLKSFKEDISVDRLVNFYRISHLNDLDRMGIKMDSYYLTHSYENEFFSRRIFSFLIFDQLIFENDICQFFDIEKNIFLPDRYVIGSCPKCKCINQYGDVCENCSYRYDAVDLLNPISILSNTEPLKKNTRHYFFYLKKFENFLNFFCKSLSQKSISSKLYDWFSIGLKDWDISRDWPYFGFKIPNQYFKFFYVWLDAPIGYISSLYNFCLIKNLDFSIYFNSKSDYDLYQFIGKDIIYFHTLFWPAILKASDFRRPNDIFVHGFLTINGKKMSKSSGTLLVLNDFLCKFEPDYIRYYFASKINDNVSDIDFSIDEFFNKINADLVCKFVNIGSRCLNIICKYFSFKFSPSFLDKQLFDDFLSLEDLIKECYDKRLYSRVVFHIMKHVDYINLYLDREKPWFLVKNKDTFTRAHDVCTVALNLFIILLIYIKPILPDLFDRFEYILNLNNFKLDFGSVKKPILGIEVKQYIHVYKKLINETCVTNLFK